MKSNFNPKFITPGFILVGKKKIRAFLVDGKPVEVYDKGIGDYIPYYKVKQEIENGTFDMEREKRVIEGKARTCKITGNKIYEVYDEDKKVYVPYEEFLRQQEEYKTNPIVDDTKVKEEINKDAKKDKKVVIREEEKKSNEKDKKVVTGSTTTSNINFSTSGTSGADISMLPKNEIQINVKTETKKEKYLEKNYDNVVEEYVDLLYQEE